MMKKLFLASLAIAALASCQKESLVDSTLTSDQQEMTFAPYAGASLTKGAAVGSNADFKGTEGSYGSFNVSAHNGTGSYYGFDQITYDGEAWGGETTRYWPVDYPTMYFGAYYPATNTSLSNAAYSYATDAHSLKFDYEVGAVATQKDLMYAITAKTATDTDYSVGLHFKHALTQIGFTATKSTKDISVTVSSITICNVVDNGAFEATTNTNDSGNITSDQSSTAATSAGDIWTPSTAAALKEDGSVTTTNLTNYAATMAFVDDATSIAVTGSDAVTLTSAADVLMLLPQELTAWVPNDDKYLYDSSTEGIAYGTDSYLAIDCVITGAGDEVIIDGIIYVPFSTAGIEYNLTDKAGDGTWLPGYKITYNLAFGGGYAIPGTDPDPEPQPGEVPDNVVPTLRTITYTVTVDDWIPVAGGDVAL